MITGIEAFEVAFRARRRRRLVIGLAAGILLAACLLLCAVISEVYASSLIDGAPRVGIYLAKLIPDLRLPVLFAGSETEGSLAYWMYRIDLWLWLLFETSQIAALATLCGAVLALLLCFLAAANLAPRYVAYFLARR